MMDSWDSVIGMDDNWRGHDDVSPQGIDYERVKTLVESRMTDVDNLERSDLLALVQVALLTEIRDELRLLNTREKELNKSPEVPGVPTSGNTNSEGSPAPQNGVTRGRGRPRKSAS